MKRFFFILSGALIIFVVLVMSVGCTGPVGPQGPQGPAGAQGVKGEKGERGPAGEQGLRGVQGPKGDDGEKGDKGKQGDDGERGYTGATGPKGDTGEQGLQGEQGPIGPQGEPGLSGTYLLLEKKTGDPNWIPVYDGTFGCLFFVPCGPYFEYQFEAQGLLLETGYSLIYYCDGWPGIGSILIGSGTSDENGDLYLSGSPDLESNIPKDADTNFPEGKIWLVLSSDFPFDETGLWNPTSYLFEHNTITYMDTDLP